MKYAIEAMPENAEELQRILPGLTGSPEGAAAGCVMALHILSENAEEGLKALQLIAPETSRSTLRLAQSQLENSPWIIRSYFLGTGPEGGYRLPGELLLGFSTNSYSGNPESGSVKFFLECSGASSPRPVTVKRDCEGNWHPHEWSSLIVGVISPG